MKKANKSTTNIRHAFVAFLFSLVAAEIAKFSTPLLEIAIAGNFTSRLIAPATHLFLALVVVTASWVGWSRTVLQPESPQVKSIFQNTFLILLIDILLVILYFALVRTVEITPDGHLSELSAANEVTLICVIFFIYWLWDILHDVWADQGDGKEQKKFFTRESLKKCLVFSFASFVSFLCVFLILFLYKIHPATNALISVYTTDVALLAVVVGFRALKGAEKPIADWLHIKHERKEPAFKWLPRLWLYGSVYLISVVTLNISKAWLV